jgi:hypothetical protein
MRSGTLNTSRINRSYLTVFGAVIIVLVSLWLYFGPVPEANAENFCQGVNLARYGQPGDRCTAPNGGWMYYVVVETGANGGCEATQNNGVQIDAWVCTGPHSAWGSYHNSNIWSHGIIRNNDTTKVGTFWGGQAACPNQGCA